MTTPAIDRLTRELIASVHSLKSLYGDPTVISFGRTRARERVIAASERLEAEMARPVQIAAWTPFNQRDSYKPGGAL